MNAQTENKIIAEITATAVKTIEQTVRKSLKRVLPENFPDKTTAVAVKRIKSSMVPEFKNKENKIRYEASSIMEKIDEAISAIENSKTERCQEKLTEGKKVIFKQQKTLRIADREEDGWEVVQCYLSDNFASDSEDEKQLSIARGEAAENKKKKSKKMERTSFRMLPLRKKIPKSLAIHAKDTMALGITQKLQNQFCLRTRRAFSIFLPK